MNKYLKRKLPVITGLLLIIYGCGSIGADRKVNDSVTTDSLNKSDSIKVTDSTKMPDSVKTVD